jgi:hypothetical protein
LGIKLQVLKLQLMQSKVRLMLVRLKLAELLQQGMQLELERRIQKRSQTLVRKLELVVVMGVGTAPQNKMAVLHSTS